MSEGQMIAQMAVSTPSPAAMTVASPVTSLPVDGQEASLFAGLLRDMSAHVTTKPVVSAGVAKALQAGNSDAMGTEPAPAQVDTPPDIMATLLAMVGVGKEVAPSSPAVDEPDPRQPQKTEQQEDSIPQNVVLPAAEIQVAPAQQVNGRMPESAITRTVDERAVATQTAGTAELGESFRKHAVVLPETVGISSDSNSAATPAIQQNAASVSGRRETPVASVNAVSASLEIERSVIAGTAPAGQEMSPLPTVDAVTCDTGVTLASRIPVDAKHNGLRVVQEAQSSKPDAPDTVNSAESRSGNVVAATMKKVMAPASGESFGQDGKSASDQKTGAQDTMMLLHQLKTESAPVVAGTFGSPASEPVRTNVMEQVISQVREHLAGRDIKNGVEQVVIRLSPDNLGELKLNLRMENQCLKVEIVAENSMVRDTLIKHSDTLKETLARQNITMETFDVSTGSNRNGFASNGQSQSNWQELARQQRNTAWNISGGYRVSDTPELPQRTLYQSSTEHSMVDVHF